MFGSQMRKEEIKKLEHELTKKRELLKELSYLENEVRLRTNRLEETQLDIDKKFSTIIDNINRLFEDGQKLIGLQKIIKDGLKAVELIKYGSHKPGQEYEKGITWETEDILSPEKSIQEYANEAFEHLEAVQAKLADLDRYSTQMGVFALNAAIEAGKMGEHGRSFVNAAEEVRKLAGQYQELTGEIQESGSCILKSIKDIGQMTEVEENRKQEFRKESAQLLEKQREEQVRLVDDFQRDMTKNILAVSNKFEELQNKSHELMQNFRVTYSDAAELGDFFAAVQKNVKEIQEIQQSIRAGLKKVD